MDKPVYRRSVIAPHGLIDVTGSIPEDPSREPYIEITQNERTVVITRSLARSLAGTIAAGAAKIEAAMLADDKPATGAPVAA